MRKIVVMYITQAGERVAKKIKKRVKEDIYIKKLEAGSHKEAFFEAFNNYDVLIAVMAVGIVVRGIAPHLRDKSKDPAVVVVDEKGKFVISLLSGHIGGANEVAIELAEKIKATPVITTASDLNNYPAIDVYAKKKGYLILDKTHYKALVMSMLKGKKIAVFIEEGEDRDYFEREPFEIISDMEDFKNRKFPKIYIGHRKIDDNTLHLITKKLSLGIGFHKGLEGEKLYDFIKEVFDGKGYFLESISKIATIDKREGEKGLAYISEKLKAKIYYFAEEDLKKVTIFEESKKVLKYHAVGNIAEPCAYLASFKGEILLPKVKGGNITLCVAKERCL